MKNFEKQCTLKTTDRPYAVNIPEPVREMAAGYVAGKTLLSFTRGIIEQFGYTGKIRAKEIYTSTLSSFLTFRAGKDIALKKIGPEIMLLYESYLLFERKISRNSSSFYMRVLRAIYNRAVEHGITKDNRPFRYVYIGIDKTVKRALCLRDIKRVNSLDLAQKPNLAFARDLFMFSFYTRGMSFVDMAFLKKTDLRYGILTYRRRKTGQQLQVKWERCMQEIIDRYSTSTGEYLLPIIREKNADSRLQYQTELSLTNTRLKKIGRLAGIDIPLTTYVARHSWASIAKSRNIPLSVISEGMGHDSEKTTQIYLASLESSIVDRANELVIKALLE